MVRIFHVATAADWSRARRSGSYATSTRGRTLAEEGFLHAARPEQVRGVLERFYADVEEPLVLLTIETALLDRLGVAWREDRVGPEPSDTFPHVYGALPPEAVVAVQPIGRDGSTPSFTTLFVGEIAWRIGLALLAMVAAVLGSVLAGLPGALAGLALGAAVAVVVARRRA